MAKIKQIEDFDPPTDEIDADEGVSLEELRRSYAGLTSTYPSANHFDPSSGQHDVDVLLDGDQDVSVESDGCPVTPTSIIEALLFVGKPDGQGFTAEEIASHLRGMTVQDVEHCMQRLEKTYRDGDHAFQIVEKSGQFQLSVREECEQVLVQPLGQGRELRLSQAALDCLALISYQPGITKAELESQWKRPIAGPVSALLRHDLIELRRRPDLPKNVGIQYFPTDRLLGSLGIDSLEELPRVEDFE